MNSERSYTVAPYETDKPIYYEFTLCPAAEVAIRHGLTDIMPARSIPNTGMRRDLGETNNTAMQRR